MDFFGDIFSDGWMDVKLISAEMENADVLVGILVGYNIHIGTGIRWGEDVHTVHSVYVQCTVCTYTVQLGTENCTYGCTAFSYGWTAFSYEWTAFSYGWTACTYKWTVCAR